MHYLRLNKEKKILLIVIDEVKMEENQQVIGNWNHSFSKVV